MPRPRAGSQELREALLRLGARRVEAILVAALAETGSLGTSDLVDRTGLRQPEVSVGMQELRDRDWVETETVPRDGKGRPMHRYRLVASPAKVRRHYEEQGRNSVEQVQQAMQALRRRLV